VCWLFPGLTVRIDATCLDCGDPLAVEMRDGELVRVDPPTVVGHLNNPWSIMAQDRAYG
jgi:hypothetical protein